MGAEHGKAENSHEIQKRQQITARKRQVLGGGVTTPRPRGDKAAGRLGQERCDAMRPGRRPSVPARGEACKQSCSPLGGHRCDKGLWGDEQLGMSAWMWVPLERHKHSGRDSAAREQA